MIKKIINYTIKDSILGSVLIAKSDTGVCAILMDEKPAALIHDLKRRFPDAAISRNDKALSRLAGRVVKFIKNPKTGLDVQLDFSGSNFQKRVWNVLRKIAVGKTASYSEIAGKLNRPDAARAVATACAANAHAVIIPCHRVVRSDGKLSGYRWGIERKQSLLKIEGAL